MRLSTQTLASASARHPWWTIGAWIAVSILAMVAVAFGLGNLTTEGAPTNNPESERAIDAKFRAFRRIRTGRHGHRRRTLGDLHRRRSEVRGVRGRACCRAETGAPHEFARTSTSRPGPSSPATGTRPWCRSPSSATTRSRPSSRRSRPPTRTRRSQFRSRESNRSITTSTRSRRRTREGRAAVRLARGADHPPARVRRRRCRASYRS